MQIRFFNRKRNAGKKSFQKTVAKKAILVYDINCITVVFSLEKKRDDSKDV